MKKAILRLIILLFTGSIFAQADIVSVVNDAKGMKLMVNGEAIGRQEVRILEL